MIKMVQVAQIETLINAALKVIGREVIFKVASVARGRKRPIADYQRCPEVRGEFVVSGGSASGAPDIKNLNRSKVFIRRTDTDFSFLGEAKQTYT